MLTTLWGSGGEVLGYLASGGFLGIAFCVFFGDPFVKLGVAGNKTGSLCVGISVCAFFLTLRFASRVIKTAKEAKDLAASAEAAFRQARKDVETERQAEAKSFAPLAEWLSLKAEDKALDGDSLVVSDLKIAISDDVRSMRISMSIRVNADPVTIMAVNMGWRDGNNAERMELTKLTVLQAEKKLSEPNTEISDLFAITTDFADVAYLDTWISFEFTRNRVVWHHWSKRVESIRSMG